MGRDAEDENVPEVRLGPIRAVYPEIQPFSWFPTPFFSDTIVRPYVALFAHFVRVPGSPPQKKIKVI